MGTVTPSPWKQLLLSAIESNSHLKHSYFVQFATIGSNGRPSNRSVVFRGFEENSDRIQINTDFRTRKIEELNHCPFAEICWYFTDSWEQFRINGRVDVIDGSNPNPAKLQGNRDSHGQSMSSFFTWKTRQSSGSKQEPEREEKKTIYYHALCVDAGLLEGPWR